MGMKPQSEIHSLLNARPYLKTLLSVSFSVFAIGILSLSFSLVPPRVEVAQAQGLETDQVTLQPARVSQVKKAPIFEIHVANNGMVYIQGAHVESVSGTNIKISTSWNTVKMSWTIRTNETYYGPRHFGTSFLDQKGSRLAIGDIQVGDVVAVNGMFEAGQSELVVKADTVRVTQ